MALSPESPEAIYEKANESLLRRQFAEAEAGFGSFMAKYPDHSLAGSAQYWLGETYYARAISSAPPRPSCAATRPIPRAAAPPTAC